jgi:glycerol-3-phosphate acyltransferase PlsY
MSFLHTVFFTQEQLPLLPALIALFGGYLSGSVPYGLVLTKLAGLGDIRKIGSGNIGATNVLRTGNKKLAALTLLLDGLKAFFPVLIAKHYHMDFAVIAALAAFAGHLFPVWLKFKGGKGVASAMGVCFALSWVLGLTLCVIWVFMAFASKYSSLSALTAFALAPLAAGLITGDYQVICVVMLIAIAVWIKHHENIKRLLNGTEGRISFAKKT